MDEWKQLPVSQQRLLQAIRVLYPPKREFSRSELNATLEESGVNSKTTTHRLNLIAEESKFLERSEIGGHPFVYDTGAGEDEIKMGITPEDLKTIASQVANRYDEKLTYHHLDWESWDEVVNYINSIVGESVLSIATTPNKYHLTKEGYDLIPVDSIISSIFENEEDDMVGLVEGAIRTGESETVEFKESLPGYVEKIAYEIVALGNHRGGVLIIGVSDDGVVKGLSDISEAEERVTGVVQESVEGPFPEIRKAEHDGKNILVIKIPERNGEFYTINGVECYRRVGTSKQQMTIDEIRREWENST